MAATSIHWALDGGDPPPRAYDPMLGGLCNWCSFKDRCIEDGD